MKDALIVTALSVVPRNRGARLMGWFARTGLSSLVTRAFVRVYGVDMSEAYGDIDEYPTLEALFTRTLKPGVRPIDDGYRNLVSPVDGTCAAVGRTTDRKVEVAPGRQLDLSDLIGEPLDTELDVAVLYLSPKDYHRVHVPREGRATHWRYLPGTLWPVFPAAVRRVDGLFARNERLTFRIATSEGALYAVLVGAFGVGRITSPHLDVVTNTGSPGRSEAIEPAVALTRGSELGTFHLGSTVVLAAPPDAWTWTVTPGEPVRVGRPIAHCGGQGG